MEKGRNGGRREEVVGCVRIGTGEDYEKGILNVESLGKLLSRGGKQ